jgi:hypothetical protein
VNRVDPWDEQIFVTRMGVHACVVEAHRTDRRFGSEDRRWEDFFRVGYVSDLNHGGFSFGFWGLLPLPVVIMRARFVPLENGTAIAVHFASPWPSRLIAGLVGTCFPLILASHSLMRDPGQNFTSNLFARIFWQAVIFVIGFGIGLYYFHIARGTVLYDRKPEWLLNELFNARPVASPSQAGTLLPRRDADNSEFVPIGWPPDGDRRRNEYLVGVAILVAIGALPALTSRSIGTGEALFGAWCAALAVLALLSAVASTLREGDLRSRIVGRVGKTWACLSLVSWYLGLIAAPYILIRS